MKEFREKHPFTWFMISIVVVFSIAFMITSHFHFFGVGIYDLQIDDDTLVLYFQSEPYMEIRRKGIESVEITDDFDRGEAVDLLWDSTYTCGEFKNDTLGTYKLFVKDEYASVLIVEADHKYYVFNYDDDNGTSELYNALLEWTAEP